jgi:hypothetical protein
MSMITSGRLAWSAALLLTALAPTAAVRAQSAAPAGRPAAAPTDTTAPAKATSNLSGRWTLNEKLSDDPQEKLGKRMGGPGMQGGPGMGGGPPGGMGGPPPGMGPEGGSPKGPRLPKEMVVEQLTDRILLSERGKIIRQMVTANVKDLPPKAEDGTPQIAARWDSGRLLIKAENQGRARRLENWALSEDGGQLIVTTRIQPPDGGEPIDLKLVYDRNDD